MIVPDRTFVRQLRRTTRALVKADPALRRERRRVQQRWTRKITVPSLRWLLPLLIAAAVAGTQRPEEAIPFLTIWTLSVTLFRAGQFVGAFNRGPVLWIFYALPTDNQAVFRHQVSGIFRAAVWLALDWLAFGIVAAVHSGQPMAWMAAFVFAIAQALTALAVAWFFAFWRPKFPFGAVGVYISAGMYVFLQLTRGGTSTAAIAGPILRAFVVATPGGWLASADTDVLAGGWMGWIVALALGCASGGWIWQQTRRARATFSLERIIGYEDLPADTPSASEPSESNEEVLVGAQTAAEMATARDEAEAERARSREREAQISAAALDACRARVEEVLNQAPGLAHFYRGWLEGRVTRLLSPRRRVLLDFLQPRGPRWGRQWVTAFALIALAYGLHVAGYHDNWIAVLPAVALAFFALPTFGGLWLGLQPVRSSNGQIGVHAFLPLGFFELVSTMLAINALRCVIAVPLVILAARNGFTPSPLPWGETFGLVIRVLTIVLAILPVWTVLAFSKTTNDSSSRWWFRVFIVAAILVGLFGGMSVGIGLFLAESTGARIACGAMLLAMNYGLLAIYGCAWGRRVFDIIGKSVQM
jgi:hypothetical protein